MSEDFNHFGTLANNLDGILGQIVRKTAFDGQANVQAQIRANDQIDTGFMVNSVYVVTSEESTYGKAQPTKKDSYLLPEVEQPASKTEAYLAVGANYAIFPNYGTVNLPAKPFWEPGIAKTQESFEKAMNSFEQLVKDSIGE